MNVQSPQFLTTKGEDPAGLGTDPVPAGPYYRDDWFELEREAKRELRLADAADALIDSFAAKAVLGAPPMVARRWPYVAVGWFWFLGTLAPTIGIVQTGATVVADRSA